MNIQRRMNWQITGFTLIELLFTIAILAILLMVAVPSFQDTIIRNNIETQISDFHAGLSLARTESVTRSRRVSVCRSANQAVCGNGATWAQGWIIFVDGSTCLNKY